MFESAVAQASAATLCLLHWRKHLCGMWGLVNPMPSNILHACHVYSFPNGYVRPGAMLHASVASPPLPVPTLCGKAFPLIISLRVQHHCSAPCPQ